MIIPIWFVYKNNVNLLIGVIINDNSILSLGMKKIITDKGKIMIVTVGIRMIFKNMERIDIW